MSRRPLYAYYYPAYHRTTSGWFEWDLVRNALPWFEGHQKPDVPLWGYADDAGPATFVRQARAAAAAGLDGFVFDLWWRPDGATLYQEVLDQAVMPSLAAGALPAGFRFGIMWCPVWPRLALPMGMDQPSTAQGTDRHFPFTAADLLALFDHLRPYLTHPNALRVEGRPLLSFFHAWRLRTALGDELPEALRALRARAREAGLPGLYLVGNVNQASDAALLEGAGLDALSAYVWGPEWQGPYRQDFATLAAARRADWAALARRIAPQPFLPAVTTGWDATPRGKRDWDKQRPGFPWSPIIEGNTPQAVASAVRGGGMVKPALR